MADPSREIWKRARAKRLGLLLQKARTQARRTLKETAQATGIPTRRLRAFERGTKVPSLPELALLAYDYGVPIEYFWNAQTPAFIRINNGPLAKAQEELEQYAQSISELLKEERQNLNLELQLLSQLTGISPRKLRAYEQNKEPIPVTDLELIATALQIPMERFWDAPGKLGQWHRTYRRFTKFQELPEPLQDFVAHPHARMYLEVARKLSEMHVEQLRKLAEAILEITL